MRTDFFRPHIFLHIFKLRFGKYLRKVLTYIHFDGMIYVVKIGLFLIACFSPLKTIINKEGEICLLANREFSLDKITTPEISALQTAEQLREQLAATEGAEVRNQLAQILTRRPS